jgi:hypothetical protein
VDRLPAISVSALMTINAADARPRHRGVPECRGPIGPITRAGLVAQHVVTWAWQPAAAMLAPAVVLAVVVTAFH